ncbi:trans-golgi protein gmx33 [Holotrichia oblita]|uniref:Trans-golgi protein gmx33 n=1 Tax=Holotrichia oblita TaxID=644536 RepID=A0ACB9TAS4_HOLOL|nr:trans-golgi protein gmx33 [Holotrichia oblita]
MNSGILTQRKKTQNLNKSESITKNDLETGDNSKEQSDLENEPKYTLMEEIYLLGLKDVAGHTSFWNDCLSAGLRGCMLIELGLRNRIKLENVGYRRRCLKNRKIILKQDTPTGDILLDETMKHIKETNPPVSVQNWVEYLSGDSWNPFKMKYQIRNARERLAKNLVEKGVLTTTKQNYLLFDMTVHPLIDKITKGELVAKLRDSLLTKWTTDIKSMEKRTLAMIMMAQASDVLENILDDLNDEEYELATNRLFQLTKLDFEDELTDVDGLDVMWAVFSVFLK